MADKPPNFKHMKAREVIKQTNGRFVSVTFERSTDSKSGAKGERVTRVFRTGVKKDVKGGGLKFDPESKGLITLWCSNGYRMVKESNIICIKCGEISWNR
jgi:hypothetical protein